MTTIACNRREMAADSFCDDGSRVAKIYRIKNGLVGFSGNVGLVYKLVRWLQEFGGRGQFPCEDQLTDDDGLLVLRADGIYTVDKTMIEVPLATDYGAMGTGKDICHGAFHMGATPQQAVEAACEHDPNSKGPVLVVPLVPTKVSRRKR